MNKCIVGLLTDSECHKKTFSSTQCFHNIKDLRKEDILLIKYRLSDHQFSDEISEEKICNFHKLQFLDYYTSLKYKCCDPLNKHKKNITAHLRVISLQTCQQFNDILSRVISINLIPGEKICKVCDETLRKIYQEHVENVPLVESGNRSEDIVEILPSQETAASSTPSFGSIYQTKSQEMDAIKNLLMILDTDPLERDKMSAERFRSKMEQLLLDVTQKITEKINTAYEVHIRLFDDTVTKNVFDDSKSLKDVICSLQKRFNVTKTIDEKIRILTILPQTWKSHDITKYFNCTGYMLREFRRLKKIDDVSMIRKRKEYSKVSNVMDDTIKNYYLDENNCYICPGVKQYKKKHSDSGQKELVQKRMLLYTLRDLYTNFINDYTGHERLPKFSYFAALRPEECVFAGDPGTHEICVCAEHENVKLKISALNNKFKYRDLLTAAVCNSDRAECMLHKCENCPGIEGMKNWIDESGSTLESDVINFKHWDTTGSRAYLGSHTETKRNFLDNLFSDIWNLTIHSYIADSQKNYLYDCKKKLRSDSCIIIMDFAENYSFIIQRSVQAFYYNNLQATIHPFCVYYKDPRGDEKEPPEQLSFCVISDTKEHFAYTVHAFQNKLIQILKSDFPWIENIIYFSDGAPSQYKNKNNLVNVCYHHKDFGIKVVSYNFFATSHGKSVCDGIGAIVKRTTMRHCIRSPPEKQITNPLEMYKYVSEELTSIKALWVADTDVQKSQRHLKKRFDGASTVKDTRMHHCYIPVDEHTIEMSITSFDKEKKRYKFK